jgi:hypothetical protein
MGLPEADHSAAVARLSSRQPVRVVRHLKTLLPDGLPAAEKQSMPWLPAVLDLLLQEEPRFPACIGGLALLL